MKPRAPGKARLALACCSLFCIGVHADGDGASPIQKVLELLSSLSQKVIAEGEEAQKVYDEMAEFCDDRSREIHHEIVRAKEAKEQLEAVIEKSTDEVESHSVRIEELSSKLSEDGKDLEKATKIRNHEKADFNTNEKSLMDTIDTVERAIGILSEKGGAALLQKPDKNGNLPDGPGALLAALSTVLDANAVISGGTEELNALLQESSDEELDALGAPAAAAYEKKSGGIVKTLDGMLEKAKKELQDTRSAETTRSHNFALLEQGLKDKIKFATQELGETKGKKGEASEVTAEAEGMLSVVVRDLGLDVKILGMLHRDCMDRSKGFEDETRERKQELGALATAKKLIVEATGGAALVQKVGSSPANTDLVFLQEASEEQNSEAAATEEKQESDSNDESEERPPDIQALHIVRDLGRKTKSPILTQLASKIEGAIHRSRDSGSSGDVFEKVRGMISDMLAKLEKEAAGESAQKEFCDREMSDTTKKLDDKAEDVEKLTSKIDKMTAQVTQLTTEVSIGQNELMEMAKSQGQMETLRLDQKTTFEKTQVDLTKGVEGIQAALGVLRDYYGGSGAESAGASIISILEVAESDFTGELSEAVAEESSAQSAFDTRTQTRAVLKVTKQQDVAYKQKTITGVTKALSDASNDRDGAQTELDAINEYMAKIKEQCVAKAEPYAVRKKRREEELAGLKEGLSVLSGGAMAASLLQVEQRATRRHSLRGDKQRHLAP